MNTQELLVNMTAQDFEREELEFEQEEADFNTSNCLAKVRIKEKEIRE